MHVDLQVCFILDIHDPVDPGLLKSQIEHIVIGVMNQYPTKSIQIAFVGYGGCFCVTNRERKWRWTSSNQINRLQREFNDLQVTLKFTNPCRKIQLGYDLANQLDWFAKRKIVFHLCDGPAFGLQYHTPEVPDNHPHGHAYIVLEEEVEKFATKGINLVIFKLNNNCNTTIKIMEDEYLKWSKSGYGFYVEDLTNEKNRRERIHNDVERFMISQLI